jgi:hypothetical protein
MNAATLSPDTITPTLPFDFDGFSAVLAAEEARNADRKLCKEYLGNWANNFGKSDDRKALDFEAFTTAAARLSSVAS